MAGLRRPRYLICFYCGRRTSTRYDGQTRFECPNCEATNYLDERGEITDPPVATTTAQSTPPRYAVARTASPTSGDPSNVIFCDTCLKNQHLFTTSLAQYLPEDPSDPDYDELERKYYKFRRGLEQRYPQVCAACEPKVLGRIQQAGYTAKADHLRRMIDRSRKDRTHTTSPPLKLLNTLGSNLWTAGLISQLLSHFCTIIQLLLANVPVEDQLGPLYWLLRVTSPFVRLLPVADRIANWSILASVLGVWWNPRFIQTVRGFTKHIVGLSNWYAYQLMIAFIKIAFMRLVSLPSSQNARFETQVCAHAFMAFFMVFIYNLAQRSVRTDMTPLFAPSAKSTPKITRAVEREEQKTTMSDLLDEILQEPPTASSSAAGVSRLDEDLPSFRSKSSFNPATAAISGNPFRAVAQPPSTDVQLSSLNLSDNKPQEVIRYEEEMDWSPTQSRHRAFNTFGSSQRLGQSFGQAPVDAKAGHFWYKVPPQPTTPAQRLFNPPSAPIIRTSPATTENLLFRGTKDKSHLQQKRDSTAPEEKAVEFRGPSFFPNTSKNDPRSSLSELFDQSFSLTPVDKQPGRSRSATRAGTLLVDSGRGRITRLVELAILAGCMGAWWYAEASSNSERSSQVILAVLVVCLAISLHVNADTLRSIAADRELRWMPAVGLVLGIAELSLACQFGMMLWAGSGEEHISCGTRPSWLIGILGIHQALGWVI
ncbi:Integral inner nuclear membrane protein ima1 [Pleurostoma richardsiae]|uniref:Integral inner nuclear membrane protein ima1 n=1 Tax=Pleurostoma richardsiae TaxID=41990 RepID=A0AA38VFR1_9PEZI|nr:Integral inner nuclear membrane protein ima1 [Pleurostoma richardsiae]